MYMRKIALVFVVMLICFGLLGQEDTKQLEKKLKNAIEQQDSKSLDSILCELAKINTQASAKVVLENLNKFDSNGFWEKYIDGYQTIIFWLGEFTDGGALDEIASFILKQKSKKKEMAKDILRSIRPSDNTTRVLGLILDKGPNELQEIAIGHLKKIRTNSSIRVLINALKNSRIAKDISIVNMITRALSYLTQKDCATLQGWINWFENNPNFIPPPEKGPEKSTGTAVDTIKDPEELPPIEEDEIYVLYVKCDRYGETHNLDDIGALLNRMGIPFKKVSLEEFEDDKFTLEKTLVLLSNCYDIRTMCHGETCRGGGDWRHLGPCQGPGPHNPRNHSLGQKGINKIRDFVAKGGYFFAEDWNAEDIIQRAFPKYLKVRGTVTKKDSPCIPSTLWNKDAKILPAKGAANHPYLKRIFEKEPEPVKGDSDRTTAGGETKPEIVDHYWRLDEYSPLLDYNPELVKVLIVSPELGNETEKVYKERIDAVALTFSYGDSGLTDDPSPKGTTTDYGKLKGGRVLFVLSHLGKQSSAQDKYTVQNLVLNFIAEAKHRKSAHKRKR